MAGSTYTPIATYTVPSAQANYTFTSIPATYTDLVLISNIATSASTGVSVQFNGDTAGNYQFMYTFGDGTTPQFGNVTSTSQADVIYSNTTISTQITNFMSYSNTSVRKTYVSRFNPTTQFTGFYSGEWASTAAISSIKLFTGSGTISTGSTFTLYGIAAA